MLLSSMAGNYLSITNSLQPRHLNSYHKADTTDNADEINLDDIRGANCEFN